MPKVLFLTPLPPPIHGMSYLNDLLLKSLNTRFDFVTVKTNHSDAINNIGRFSLSKRNTFSRYDDKLGLFPKYSITEMRECFFKRKILQT